jgi:hypothetical protein
MISRTAVVIVLALCLAACGSKHRAAPPATTAAQPTTSPGASAATTPQSGPGALQAEAAATAAGDIPDNQVFVAYPGRTFTIKAPEGWQQTGNGNTVTFRDKNNIVRVVVGTGKPNGAAPPHARVAKPPSAVTIDGAHGVKLTYETTSAPNPVTGKRVTLTVDRYELAKGGKLAIVDLGSPVGVDNVDAYRLMIQSFRLR